MRRGAAARLAVLTVLVAATLLGCGKKGPPVAPERRIPGPPTALSAVIDGPTVVLTWTNPTHRADGSTMQDLRTAKVYRRADTEGGEPKAAMLSSGRVVGYDEIAVIQLDEPGTVRGERRTGRWVDASGLTVGQRYVYVVTGIDSAGRSSPPSSRLVVPFAAAPEPPRSLGTAPGDGQVTVRWEPPATFTDGSPVEGEIRYVVLRGAESETPATAVAPAPIRETELVDKGLTNDATYQYAVRAIRVLPGGINAFGALTAAVTSTPVDTTPPSPPTELLAIPGGGAVRLAWRPSPEADVALYAVYRAIGQGSFLRIATTTAVTTVFTDRDVTPGTVYRYAVTALDRARRSNESARSNEARVTAE